MQEESNGELALEQAVTVGSSSQSRRAGVCPFGFSTSGSSSSPVRPGTPTQMGEGASAGVQSAGSATEPLLTNPAGSSEIGVAVVPSSAGVCPLGYGATAVAADAGPNGEAKCPLGFSSGIKQRNPLDCARWGLASSNERAQRLSWVHGGLYGATIPSYRSAKVVPVGAKLVPVGASVGAQL